MRSVLDWSHHEDVRLHQPRCAKRFRFWSTRVRGQHSPLSFLCITMILCVRTNFFEITTFPTVASEPGFMHRCHMHERNTSELWAIQVILLTSMSYFGLAVL